MAAYEVLLLNTAIPQIQAAQSGDTYVVPRDIAINATAIISANSATDALRITQTGAGNAILVEDSANPDSTPFVVTAAGDVGIGTTPGVKLDIVGQGRVLYNTGATNTGDQSVVTIGATTSGAYSSTYGAGLQFQVVNSSGGYAGSRIVSRLGADNNTANLVFQARNYGYTDSLTLDASGNLGLGVPPSAWGSSNRALQVATAGAVWSPGGADIRLSNNQYRDSASSRIYIANGYAQEYAQDSSGNHAWLIAPSGTAGNTISFTQAMTLDASGRLAIGATSVTNGTAFGGGSQVNVLKVESAGYPCVQVNTNTGGGGSLQFTNSGTVNGIIGYNASGAVNEFSINNVLSGPLVLATSNGEKARITSLGYFKASNTGTYTGGSTSQTHEFNQSADNNAVIIYGTNATLSTSGLVFLEAARNTTNNTFYALSYYNSGAGAYKFRVADSGDVTNTNGTYGTISDAKMKTDIVDAGSQWSDIKALRFRKFKMKDDPSGLVQLGVVAQEVEQTSPGLVDEHADKDAEGNDLGTTTKSVKTSVLLMKAAVALQEAMARIETLEAEVAALKGA